MAKIYDTSEKRGVALTNVVLHAPMANNRFVIKTRDSGMLTFHVSKSGGNVRLIGIEHEMNTWRILCARGEFFGNSLTADAETLEVTARKWWATRLRKNGGL